MEKKECTFLTNCFDPIRFWAALSVMILHYTAYALIIQVSHMIFYAQKDL